jgi:geranylgeranyl transferase type-2 subunit beta
MALLALLRDDFRAGLARTDAAYRQRHARWLTGRQLPDGGFANRRGNSDLYYTAFALRGLSLLEGLTPDVARAAAGRAAALFRQDEAARIRQPGGAFCDAVLALSWWDALALCDETLGPQLSPEESAAARQATRARLDSLRRPDGGWAKTDVDAAGSLYHTFLAACVYLRTGQTLPQAERAAEFLKSLAQADGGFLENRYSKRPGTNGCAAGVGLSVLLGEVNGLERHAAFIAALQDPDGGFRATAAAPLPDLLSTYTALVTLKLLGKLEPPAATAAARFGRSLESAQGGYTGFALDTTADCEYAFYGLSVEGLTASAVAAQP